MENIQHYNKKRNWSFDQPEDYKLVPLTKGHYAKVDNEDFDRVKDINWYYTKGYAKNDNIGFMHNFIIGLEKDTILDHDNGDRSDNRRQNLRSGTYKQNCYNSVKKRQNNNPKCVSYHKKADKWEAYIKYNYKKIHLGLHNTKEEAGKAYDLKALGLFGEFAKLNFPELKEEYLKQITLWNNKKTF